MNLATPRVTIVHERFTEWGGSESVVAELHRMWPDAPIHTTVLDRSILRPPLADADIRPSGLQRLYRPGGPYAHLLPLLPLAMSRMPLGSPDVVLASHHAFANRVTVPPGAKLVSYVHTPARWVWDPGTRRSEVGGLAGRSALAAFAASQRGLDVAAARRATLLVANSRSVAERIATWWERTAVVVAPPVDTAYFTPDPSVEREDFFLLAGRLVPYKRPDVAVAAARRAGVRLVVAGQGRMLRTLARMAGPETTLLGAVPRQELRRLFRTCRALVFPGEEDFGIVPVEAQACGAPVIAARRGGALDTVVDGSTGLLYDCPGRGTDDDVAALAGALERFDPSAYQVQAIRHHAERFSVQAFRAGICDAVGTLL